MMLEKVFWTWRVSASSSGDCSTTSGSSWMRATRYGSVAVKSSMPHALAAVHEDAQRPVGHLQHAGDDPDDADAVDVVGTGRLDLRVLARDHHEHAVPGQDVVHELRPSAPGRSPAE